MDHLTVTICIGEHKHMWQLPDPAVLQEGREGELVKVLGVFPFERMVEYIAEKAGLRPKKTAEMEALLAFKGAQDRGASQAELDELLDQCVEAGLRVSKGEAAALEYRAAAQTPLLSAKARVVKIMRDRGAAQDELDKIAAAPDMDALMRGLDRTTLEILAH